MSSSHLYITKDISKNIAVQEETRKLVRYMTQRGGIDNTVYLSAAVNSVATTAQTVVPALVVDSGVGFNSNQPVVGGRTYKFRAYLPCTVNGTSGIVLDWAGGSATFSQFAATGFNYVGSTLTLVQTTAAATATATAAAAYTTIIVEGTFTASGSGTFAPRAGLTTGTTAAVFLAGGYLQVTEIALGAA